MINWAGSYHNYSSKESFNVFQLWGDHVRSVHFSAVWPRLCCQYIFMSKILAEALSITIREIDFYLIFLMKWWRWDINRQDDSYSAVWWLDLNSETYLLTSLLSVTLMRYTSNCDWLDPHWEPSIPVWKQTSSVLSHLVLLLTTDPACKWSLFII